MSNRLALFLCLLVVGASCVPAETAWRRTPGPTSEHAAGSPASVSGIQRDPADLLVLPGESSVVSAFARAGMPVRMIGASKFEGMLGVIRPARVFTAADTWGAGGADVLFLDEDIGDVRVCTVADASTGSSATSIYVNGARTDRGEWSRPVYYLMSDRFFVQAWDEPTRDALASGLGLTALGC
jgi:hypothetical protein